PVSPERLQSFLPSRSSFRPVITVSPMCPPCGQCSVSAAPRSASAPPVKGVLRLYPGGRNPKNNKIRKKSEIPSKTFKIRVLGRSWASHSSRADRTASDCDRLQSMPPHFKSTTGTARSDARCAVPIPQTMTPLYDGLLRHPGGIGLHHRAIITEHLQYKEFLTQCATAVRT
ncbi:hypothetical protein SAMN04488049_1011, partial [Tritonibacter multivorans]